ncbi:MAG: DNA mismatch repair endonuclease MutL [Treponema sp.]|nr:DNA mismatch repair endonuclease MutL [Treponema sp.]
MSIKNPVHQLNAEVARKIAAGEVIDRPNAIVRELMDNAIDSGAVNITVEISEGGIEKIRIVDNGCGLTENDLANCARPHATSKISTETDLLNLTTLGFRGEALSSIAAVCRLSISSGGKKMRASITEDHIIEPTTPTEGTIVCAEGLFENFPARRQFLKRAATEGVMCKATFIEKTLPLPEKAFRFVQDGEIKLNLTANQTLTDRFVQALELHESPSLFNEISGQAPGSNPDWSFKIIIGSPGVYRNNKKNIYIYVNGRRIQEYSLVQAVEYGSTGYFPNGNFPVAAVFVTMKPSLVDFNIHPAKKEARFKDISSLHHGISSCLRSFFSEYTNSTMKKTETNSDQKNNELFTPSTLAEEALKITSTQKNSFSDFSEASARNRFFSSSPSSGWNGYSSRQKLSENGYKIRHNETDFFNLPQVPQNQNLITEKNPSKEFHKETFSEEKVRTEMEKIISAYTEINEHKNTETTHNAEKTDFAAKETESQPQKSVIGISQDFHFIGSALGTFLICEQNNTLYLIDKHAAHERMIFDKIMENQGKCQTLLIPYVINTESESEDQYLKSIQDELCKIGFNCSYKGNGRWEFTTLQERWHGTEEDLYHALLDKKINPDQLIYSIAAMTACKAAVKDGSILDDNAAEKIARGALSLSDPHCPHGRPCYTTITRENLFSLVRRTDS